VDISDKPLEFVGLIPRHTRDGKKIKGLMYVYLLKTDTQIEPDFSKAIDGEEHTEWAYFTKEEISSEKSGDYLHKLAEIILQ
jgi:hypothetical protein